MVDDKDDASREERRQQKHKEKDFDPPRVRQCVTRIVCSRFSLSLVRRRTTPTTNTKRRLFIFLFRIMIAHVSLSLSFSLSLFSSTRWLHRFGLQKYSETLRKLTNEQFLELKLHPDFAKHEIFDTADKQKLQKAISVLRKERSKTTGTVGRSPRTSEGGSSIVSSSSITTDSSLSSPRNTHTHATNGGAAKTPRNATGARKTSSNVQPQLQPQKQQQDKHQIVHQRKRTSNAVVAAPTSASASSSP